MGNYIRKPSRKMAAAAKKVLSFFPPSFPAKLYHFLALFPPVRFIAHSTIRALIPPRIQLEEVELILNQKDVTVCGALALGMFEKRELEIFRHCLKPGMTVIDIGANIGLYTAIASKKTHPNGKVFAFEPEAENFSYLEKNIVNNNYSSVIALPVALSNQSGLRQLFLADNNKGHHSFAKDKNAHRYIEITTETLDSSLEKYGSPIVDLIKMDIEGAEPLALDGMKKTIARNPNITIFTEIYPRAIRRLGQNPLNFLNSLHDHGLSIWIIDENLPQPLHLPQGNFERYVENFPKENLSTIYMLVANL